MTVIAESIRQRETLIDDILSFSRISLNEMSKTRVDLDKLVKDVIQEFKSEADG